jgi:hypothetical protein
VIQVLRPRSVEDTVTLLAGSTRLTADRSSGRVPVRLAYLIAELADLAESDVVSSRQYPDASSPQRIVRGQLL